MRTGMAISNKNELHHFNNTHQKRYLNKNKKWRGKVKHYSTEVLCMYLLVELISTALKFYLVEYANQENTHFTKNVYMSLWLCLETIHKLQILCISAFELFNKRIQSIWLNEKNGISNSTVVSIRPKIFSTKISKFNGRGLWSLNRKMMGK